MESVDRPPEETASTAHRTRYRRAMLFLRAVLPAEQVLTSIREGIDAVLADASAAEGAKVRCLPKGADALADILCSAVRTMLPTRLVRRAAKGSEALCEMRDVIAEEWVPLEPRDVRYVARIMDVNRLNRISFADVLAACADVSALESAMNDASGALPRWLYQRDLTCRSHRPVKLCRGRLAMRLDQIESIGTTPWTHDSRLIIDGLGGIFNVDRGSRAGAEGMPVKPEETAAMKFTRGDAMHAIRPQTKGTITDVCYVGGAIHAFAVATAASDLIVYDPAEKEHDHAASSVPCSVQALLWVDVGELPTVTAKAKSPRGATRTIREMHDLPETTLLLGGDRTGALAAWRLARRNRGRLAAPELIARMQLRAQVNANGEVDEAPVRMLALTLQTSLIVVATVDSVIHVIGGLLAIDLDEGYLPWQELYCFTVCGGAMRGAALSPHQQGVFCGSMDGTVELWLLGRTGKGVFGAQRVQLRDPTAAHTAPVVSVACSDDVTMPLAASADSTGLLRFWDLRTMGLLQSLQLPVIDTAAPPRSLTFTADTRCLYAVSRASVLQIVASEQATMAAVRHAALSSEPPRERNLGAKIDRATLGSASSPADGDVDRLEDRVARMLAAGVSACGDGIVVRSGGIQWTAHDVDSVASDGARAVAFLPYPRGSTSSVHDVLVSAACFDHASHATRVFLGLTSGDVWVVNALTGGVCKRFLDPFTARKRSITCLAFLSHANALLACGTSGDPLDPTPGDVVTLPLKPAREGDTEELGRAAGDYRGLGNVAFYVEPHSNSKPSDAKLVFVGPSTAIPMSLLRESEDRYADDHRPILPMTVFDSAFVGQTGNVAFSSLLEHEVPEDAEAAGDDGRQLSEAVPELVRVLAAHPLDSRCTGAARTRTGYSHRGHCRRLGGPRLLDEWPPSTSAAAAGTRRDG
jgi:WD40 repeat protein